MKIYCNNAQKYNELTKIVVKGVVNGENISLYITIIHRDILSKKSIIHFTYLKLSNNIITAHA